MGGRSQVAQVDGSRRRRSEMHDTGCRPGTGTGDTYILHLYILRIYPVSTYGVGILYVSTRYIL